jgi:TatD DNase family protein
MLIDSHAHLDDIRFGEDREEVIGRARDAGIRRILTIGNGAGPDDMGCGIPIAQAHEDVVTSVGIHPHDAVKMRDDHLGMMERLASHPRVVAIGETGLDFHYDHSPRHIQVAVFRAQVELAMRLDLPVIIHTREADAETIAILEELCPSRGVVHCFTGGDDLADRALELGLMISFSGILTFKGSDAVRRIAARVPGDRILVETDSPYLAPVPFRGKRNEPAYVSRTAEALSALRGETAESIGERTTANFEALFGRSERQR